MRRRLIQLAFAALALAGFVTSGTDAATGHPAAAFWPAMAGCALAVVLDEDLHKP